MSYTRVNWQDAPSVSTPLSASNLNKMDAGIKKNADDIEQLQQHTYDAELDGTSTNAPQTQAVYEAMQRINVETDPTLSVAGKAADAAATGSELTDVKSALSDIADATVVENSETVTENIFPSLTWTDNKFMGLDGVPRNGTGYRYSNKFSVSPGDSFAFANPNFGFGYITAFNGDTPIPESGQQGGKTYTVLSGTNAIVITENMSRGDAAINWTHQLTTYTNIMEERVSAAEQDIDSLEDSMNVYEYTEDVSVSTVPVFTTGAVDQNGSTYTSSSYSAFQYSQKIPATNGSLIECLDAAGNQVKMRWVCAYKNNVAVPASGINADVFSFNLSGDVDSVVVTCRISGNVVAVKVTTPTESKAYFTNAKVIPIGFMSKIGSLADEEVLYLPKTNVKNENVLIFSANITSFGSVKIGKQSNTYVIVDATNITLHNTANPDTYVIPHNLTIGHNITVMVQTETSLDASLIRVSSDGVSFDYTTPARRFVMDDGTPYAISIGSVLTDCNFAWTSKSISAPIWIFGDSYLSYWDTNWTKFLIDDGYVKNCMLNGFAGESSARAYESLENLLAITTPKIVVWCLGMNDPDNVETWVEAVNPSWKLYYDKAINLSKKYGFKLVLYTVPTTPTMDNKYKDAIIRASGYRYIEADKAVRINDSGEWVSGALQSDNVHPSAIGGNIIYNRILTDFPEIMVNW